MIIHPLKLFLKTVLKSLDHEQGNCFLLENLWSVDVISTSLKNFCLFFPQKLDHVNARKQRHQGIK